MSKSILIVDDNACVRQIVRRTLEREAICESYDEATNGVDAIKRAKQGHPSLVILDFSMLILNGLEVTRELRKVCPLMPIILFTVFKDASLERDAFAAGASVVTSKLEGIEMLADQVRFLLRHSIATQEPDILDI